MRPDPLLKPQQKAFVYFSIYACVLLLFRSFICNATLSYDEAEQIVFAQTFAAGYPAQPPLYDWMQWLIFQGLGVNLFSLSVLKFTLVAACFYVYYLICSQYCAKNETLIWCATLSWALIPNISYDFLPHRTHVILALLASALTWYWFIKPCSSKLGWYLGLGIIIGIGLLSKFNYLLFLAVLFTAALTVKPYRLKMLTPQFLVSIALAVLISSPYCLWLLHHQQLGFHASYKLNSPGDSHWYGWLRLVKASLCFILPFMMITLFFPLSTSNNSRTPETQLLWRYHLLLFPLLFFLVEVTGMNTVRTHWLVPILFLYPVCLFCLVKEKSYSARKTTYYLILCLAVQFLIVCSWVMRVPKSAQFPLTQVIGDIKKENKAIAAIVSDSHWLLGSLMLALSVRKGVLVYLTPDVLAEGNLLMAWEGIEQSPRWLKNIKSSQQQLTRTITTTSQHRAISRSYRLEGRNV
jgi:4-amino-4-deoxy-L-arabinose transferase-like glycosyltransferase